MISRSAPFVLASASVDLDVRGVSAVILKVTKGHMKLIAL